MTAPRIAPLKPEEMNERQQTFLKPYSAPDGSTGNVFATLARHMDLLEAWSDFGLHAMVKSNVDPKLREICVLRTAVNCDSPYEWHHHARIGRQVGLSKEVIDRIQTGAALDSKEQDLMVACADDLSESTTLSDKTWKDMIDTFGLEYTLDIIFTVGAYTTMAMALNSCGVQIEARREQ